MVNTDTDTDEKAEPAVDDGDTEPAQQGVVARLTSTARTANAWVSTRVVETRDWARHQPPRMLAQWAVAVVLGLTLAYTALRVLGWLVTSVISLVTGSADEPAPEPPQPPDRELPGWAQHLGQNDLVSALVGNLHHWVERQASMTAVPGTVLLGVWALAGVTLLLMTVLHAWCHSTNRMVSALGWWGWLAATVWLIWTHTPGHTPVPAALAAATGVALSVAPLTTTAGATGMFVLLLI